MLITQSNAARIPGAAWPNKRWPADRFGGLALFRVAALEECQRRVEHATAVDAGETQVGDQNVVREFRQALQRVFTVGHLLDVEAMIREAFGPTLDALPASPTSYTLYFLEGKDELTDESRVELESVFADLKRRPGRGDLDFSERPEMGAERRQGPRGSGRRSGT